MSGTLFIIGTPLGNLADVSAHAATCLQQVAYVYAEDTRRSMVLLDHLGVKKPLRSLHAHNEQGRSHQVLELLSEGHDVAVLTDAGTPAVSDPGAEVVAAAHAAGLRVSPVAGPSALTAALSVAGFGGTAQSVLFLGFLPSRGKEQREALQGVADHRGIAVLFEAPHRAKHTVAQLALAEPERHICMCREMTKVYEEIRRAPAAELNEWLQAREVLGEITLVLGPSQRPLQTVAETEIEAAIDRCLEAGLSSRDTAAAVAAVLQVKKRDVYARCLARDRTSS